MNLNFHLLRSQHSMSGHPRPASETPLDRATIIPLAKAPFVWRFARGPKVSLYRCLLDCLCLYTHRREVGLGVLPTGCTPSDLRFKGLEMVM